MSNLYIDAEWFPNQQLFLIGYARENASVKQLYSKSLNKTTFKRILDGTRGRIFFYGPDIALCENHFDMDIRNNYNCVNLLRITRACYPRATSWKLEAMEKRFGLRRDVVKYKRSIFEIYGDWRNPKYRQRVLQYNLADVYNLVRVKQKVFEQFHITPAYLNEIRLR